MGLNERQEKILEEITNQAIEDGTLEEWKHVESLIHRLDAVPAEELDENEYAIFDPSMFDFLWIPEEKPEESERWVMLPPISRDAFDHLCYLVEHLKSEHPECEDARLQLGGWLDEILGYTATAIMEVEDVRDAPEDP